MRKSLEERIAAGRALYCSLRASVGHPVVLMHEEPDYKRKLASENSAQDAMVDELLMTVGPERV